MPVLGMYCSKTIACLARVSKTKPLEVGAGSFQVGSYTKLYSGTLSQKQLKLLKATFSLYIHGLVIWIQFI